MAVPSIERVAGTQGTGAAAPGRAADPKMREAARGLEEILVKEMLTAMTRAQLENGGFFGGGSDGGTRETTFELMLSQALSATEPFGLGDQLSEQMARNTGVSGGSSPRGSLAEALAAGIAASRDSAMDAVAGPGGVQTAAAAHGSVSRRMSRNFTSGTQGHPAASDEEGGDIKADRRKPSPAAEDDR